MLVLWQLPEPPEADRGRPIMRRVALLPACAALSVFVLNNSVMAQPTPPDLPARLEAEEQRLCDLAEDQRTTVAMLADAQTDADAILVAATASLMAAELERLEIGASLLVAAANAFVETRASEVEMARIALGGTIYTLATVLVLKAGDLDSARAVLSSGAATQADVDAASALAVELYVALSLHGSTLASAAGLVSGDERLFPELGEIFLFKSDVPALLSAAPNISAMIDDLGPGVLADLGSDQRDRMAALASLENVVLPGRRADLELTEQFHQRASNCIAPKLN
jgi:hypothetical protein